MGLIHMVEGLGTLGSRAAAQLAASRLQDKKNKKKQTQTQSASSLQVVQPQTGIWSADLSIILLLHLSSLTRISISSLR